MKMVMVVVVVMVAKMVAKMVAGGEDGSDGDGGDDVGDGGGKDCGFYRLKHIGKLCDDGRVERGEKGDGAQKVYLVFHLLQPWAINCDFFFIFFFNQNMISLSSSGFPYSPILGFQMLVICRKP